MIEAAELERYINYKYAKLKARTESITVNFRKHGIYVGLPVRERVNLRKRGI